MSAVNVPLFPEQSLISATPGSIEGRPYDIGDFRELDFQVIVRGILGTGTPSVAVSIQTSMDMRDWTILTSVGPFTTETNVSGNGSSFLRYVRARLDLVGTDISTTVSVLGIAKD